MKALSPCLSTCLSSFEQPSPPSYADSSTILGHMEFDPGPYSLRKVNVHLPDTALEKSEDLLQVGNMTCLKRTSKVCLLPSRK